MDCIEDVGKSMSKKNEIRFEIIGWYYLRCFFANYLSKLRSKVHYFVREFIFCLPNECRFPILIDVNLITKLVDPVREVLVRVDFPRERKNKSSTCYKTKIFFFLFFNVFSTWLLRNKKKNGKEMPLLVSFDGVFCLKCFLLQLHASRHKFFVNEECGQCKESSSLSWHRKGTLMDLNVVFLRLVSSFCLSIAFWMLKSRTNGLVYRY